VGEGEEEEWGEAAGEGGRSERDGSVERGRG